MRISNNAKESTGIPQQSQEIECDRIKLERAPEECLAKSSKESTRNTINVKKYFIGWDIKECQENGDKLPSSPCAPPLQEKEKSEWN